MKKIVIFLLIIAMLFSFVPFVSATQYYYDGKWHEYHGNTFKLKVNGEILQTEMPPIVFNDYSVVPARDVFEKLGAEVGWDASTQTVTISNGSTVIKLKINSKTAIYGNKSATMPIAAKIINGKTMIPVRFVGDTLGYDVDFDSKTDTVIIEEKAEPEPETYVTGVNFSSKKNSSTLKVNTTGKQPVVKDFVLTNPLRIVVDITNAGYKKVPENIEVSTGNITAVRFGQIEGVRIVFDIKSSMDYKISKTSKGLTIVLNEKDDGVIDREEDEEKDETATPAPETTSTPAPDATPAPTPAPFSISVSSSGGRDYIKVTSGSIGKATRSSSSPSVTLEVKGEKIPQTAYEKKQSGNFINELKYKPVSKTTANVTLTMKDNNFNFVNNQGTAYVMAQKAEKLRSVMIDAGHGGSDAGAVGYDEEGNVIAKEKDFNLDVALKVRALLKKQGVEVKMIRETDTYVDFQQVGSIANDAGTSLFVSVHTNSALTEEANGIETWAYLESNASSLNGLTGKRLAELIQNELIYETKAVDRGVRNGKSLAVIKSTSMPAVLVEMGFISNEDDREKLMDESYRQKIANAIAEGVMLAFDEMGI